MAACAHRTGCSDSPYAASPQFHDCGFQNPPNPDVAPNAPTWKIWLRFAFARGTDTKPAEPLPLHRLTLGELQALDNHYHHLDAATISYLARRAERFFVPLGAVKVTATRSQHFSLPIADRSRRDAVGVVGHRPGVLGAIGAGGWGSSSRIDWNLRRLVPHA